MGQRRQAGQREGEAVTAGQPLALLDPGAGKTKKAYVWAWARSHHDPHPGVVYEFCLGRGAQYPAAFLGGKGPPSPEPMWNGTLITDQYAGYRFIDADQRQLCWAHVARNLAAIAESSEQCNQPIGARLV